MTEKVNHPPHYQKHPSGVECIQITEHMNFCLGNAVKYIWRADHKADAIEDLEKAKWYLEREIALRQKRELDAAVERYRAEHVSALSRMGMSPETIERMRKCQPGETVPITAEEVGMLSKVSLSLKGEE